MSQLPKRKHDGQESSNGPTPPKRKVKSCDACRRLKTRCELQPGDGGCHRCEVLKLDCSLGSTAEAGPQETTTSPIQPKTEAHGHHETSERLKVLEASLARVESLLERQSRVLEQVTSLQLANAKSESKREVPSPADSASPRTQRSGPLVADKNSRTAPMSLIRDMKQHILGVERAWGGWDASEDVAAKGIINEDMTRILLAGFSQLSRRWLFMRGSPESIRQSSPLLFTTCLLAGLHINPKLHGSEIHHKLYQHFNSLIGQSILCTPLSMETIQSIFIASMWNLVPNKDTGYIDSWLSSGMAAMHGMLSINFEQLLHLRSDGTVDPKVREALRTWNLICLCHLQFSIGTGRPPVISTQYLDQCENILSLPQYNPRDQLVVAGVALYSHVCRYLNTDVVQTDSVAWDDIEEWRQSCSEFYNLEAFKPLRFAYACSYLILARRTLKHLSESAPPSPHVAAAAAARSRGTSLGPEPFIHLSTAHAHDILELFTAMSSITSYVRPAYENLLCSFAMVTLSEFAGYLADALATLALMERTSIHIQLGGKAEPVSRWAFSVLRKFVYDRAGAGALQAADAARTQNVVPASLPAEDSGGYEVDAGGGGASAESYTASLDGIMWGPDAFEDQDFPSLEDMFLIN